MHPVIVIGLAVTGLYNLILNQAEDAAQEVNPKYLCSGHKCDATTKEIKKSINKILRQHKHHKIGKTVRPAKRLQGTDYRKYHTMYLVYRTSSEANIKHYETHFIGQYFDRLDNKHENSTGRVAAASVKGMHYLYVVAAD